MTATVLQMPARLRLIHADVGEVEADREIAPHRVLVVANSGLAHPDFVDTVVALGAGGPVEALIVAPAPELAAIAERRERQEESERRLESALAALRARGVWASGWIADQTDARAALARTLDEYGADELLLVHGTERGWRKATELAHAFEAETGVLVTELEAPLFVVG